MGQEKLIHFLIVYLTTFGFIAYYHFSGSHFMCTKGDYYDPTGSISFILPGLLARMYKSSNSEDGSFVFIQFNAHHWRLSLAICLVTT